jgi:hypothetical protein
MSMMEGVELLVILYGRYSVTYCIPLEIKYKSILQGDRALCGDSFRRWNTVLEACHNFIFNIYCGTCLDEFFPFSL